MNGASAAWRGFFIRLSEPALQHYAEQFGRSAKTSLPELAASLAASPSAQPFFESAILVVRAEPRPVLGFLGEVPQRLRPLLRAHSSALVHGLQSSRTWSYEEIEEHCRGLAANLLDELGLEMVAQAAFSAIPRGGNFILAMLSYVLDLQPDQLLNPSGGACHVVVDDCALTGARFRLHLQELRECSSGPIVFAPLVSHPELRRRIQEAEGRVLRCLSAIDLEEKDTEDLKPGWRERWMRQREGLGYWTGRFEALVFPWSEPERFIWDPVHERIETAWRLTPPKHRLTPTEEADFQLQREGPGPLKPTDQVLFGELDGAVLVGHMGTEDVIRLEDTAADMWRALVQTGTADGAVQTLLAEYEVDEGTLRPDVESFVEELLERGLLMDERSR